MAAIEFQDVSKIYPDGTLRGRRARPRDPGGRVHGVRRPVRLRQDDRAQDGRRPRGDHRGRDPDRRAGRERRHGEAAGRRDGVPELRPVPAHDGGARTSPSGSSCASARRTRSAAAWSARRPRSASRTTSTASPRRSPAGSGSESRWGGRSSGSRAAFLMDEPLSNLDAQLRVQMRAEIQQAAARARGHDDLRHARSDRGDDDGRPDRRHARRAGCSRSTRRSRSISGPRTGSSQGSSGRPR